MGEHTCRCDCGGRVDQATAAAVGAAGAAIGDPADVLVDLRGPGGTRSRVSRRAVLGGSAAALAAVALAGCGSEDPSTAATQTTEESSTPEPTESESATTETEEPTGDPIASTSDFPVGGGKVVNTEAGVVVLTQPADGEFLAFNGKCPHAGCPVAEVTENTILCTCHGSTFDGSTGERLEGPAPTGLEPVSIRVEGDDILLA